MTRVRGALTGLPPFLVGVAGAVALETSAGLLLYLDEGLLPALTLILAVEVGALGLGIWSGTLPTDAPAVERVRRRWLFSLVAFALAAALVVGMEFQGGQTPGGLGQGMGLAFFGSLPLFAVGSLLGAMSRPDDLGRSPVATVGLPSVVGAAVGFLLTGGFLLPNASPYTLYLFCLVVLSGGALLQGWVLDGRPMVTLKETTWGGNGEIRVEQRVLGRPRREFSVLLEDGRLRGAEDREGNPGRAWERAVLDGLEGGDSTPSSLLFLGGGSGTFARLFQGVFPDAQVEVVERNRELVGLARTHFQEWEGWDRLTVMWKEPLAYLDGVSGCLPLVLVDGAALPSLGGVPAMEEDAWRRLSRILEPTGFLILGGLGAPSGEAGLPLRGLTETASRWFGRITLYEGDLMPQGAEVLPGEGKGAPAFMVLSQMEAPEWPATLPGFRGRVVGEV